MDPLPTMVKAYGMVLQIEIQKEINLNRELRVFNIDNEKTLQIQWQTKMV